MTDNRTQIKKDTSSSQLPQQPIDVMLLQRRCFSSTPLAFAKRKQIAIQRKKANIARQAVLQAERSPADFDPIVGKSTDFTRSLLHPDAVWSSKSSFEDTLYFPKDEIAQIQIAVEKAVQAREQSRPDFSLEKMSLHLRQTSHEDTKVDMSPVARSPEDIMQEKLDRIKLENEHKSIASSRITSLQNSNARTLRAFNTAFAIREFGRKEGDTGSAEVQAAVLTVRILSEAKHIAAHKKDVHGFKGFRELIHQRQKILKYLRRESVERYQGCIAKLGLTDQCIIREITM